MSEVKRWYKYDKGILSYWDKNISSSVSVGISSENPFKFAIARIKYEVGAMEKGKIIKSQEADRDDVEFIITSTDRQSGVAEVVDTGKWKDSVTVEVNGRNITTDCGLGSISHVIINKETKVKQTVGKYTLYLKLYCVNESGDLICVQFSGANKNELQRFFRQKNEKGEYTGGWKYRVFSLFGYSQKPDRKSPTVDFSSYRYGKDSDWAAFVNNAENAMSAYDATKVVTDDAKKVVIDHDDILV